MRYLLSPHALWASCFIYREKLDKEFWEMLDVPYSHHRAILLQSSYWEQEFQVKVKRTKDRKKIQIQGEIENVKKVLVKINEISNSR